MEPPVPAETVQDNLFAESRQPVYTIRTESFEGPLDLLLYLIKKNEVDIYNIPIAAITRQYLEYIELLKELNLDIAGEFLVMASTLVQIKSRMLLPPVAGEEETETEEEDPRAELVRRLLEYQRYKEAADRLAECETARQGRLCPQIRLAGIRRPEAGRRAPGGRAVRADRGLPRPSGQGAGRHLPRGGRRGAHHRRPDQRDARAAPGEGMR